MNPPPRPRPSPRDLSCRTKRPYPTRSQSKRAWKRLRRQPGRHHLQMYPCPHCPNWHIGNARGHQTYWRAGSPYSSGHDTVPGRP